MNRYCSCSWSHLFFWLIALLFLLETFFLGATSSHVMDVTQASQILLLSISSSLDNLGVGLALGLSGRKITTCINCYLSFLNAFCMVITMGFGNKVNRYIDEAWARRTSGMIFMLLGVAAVFLEDPGGAVNEEVEYHEVSVMDLDSNAEIEGNIELSSLPSGNTDNMTIIDRKLKRKESEDASSVSIDVQRPENSKKRETCFQRFCGAEICAIALSVSVSNLAAGFGAGLINLSIPAVSVSVHVVSYATMLIGNAGGVWARRWLNVVVLQYIAGGLLVILGLSGFYEDVVIPLPSIDPGN